MNALQKIFPWARAAVKLEAAGVSAEQAMQAAAGGAYDIKRLGFDSLEDLYFYSLGGSDPVTYTPLHRCITLLCENLAAAITEFNLVAVDDQEQVVDSETTRRAVHLLKNSPEGNICSFTWFEDLARQYLMEGNALVHVKFSVAGSRRTPISMRMLRAQDAYCEKTISGMTVYKAKYYYDSAEPERYMTFPANEIIHIRWPLFRSNRYSNGYMDRNQFAASPVNVLRPATKLGCAADGYVMEQFARPGSKIAIEYSPTGTSADRMDAKEATESSILIEKFRRAGRPVIAPRGTIKMLQDPQLEGKSGIRRYQETVIASFYGVPAVFLSSDQTTWGSGVENYVKIFQLGFKNHKSECWTRLAIYYSQASIQRVGIQACTSAQIHLPPTRTPGKML